LPVSSAQQAQAANDPQMELDMNPKTIAIAAVLAASLSVPARAQTIVDMSLISCDQFLKSPQERKDVLSAWMGGYFSAMKNLAKIDARYVVRNSQKITNYCKKAKSETLMSAIQRNWR
jgi:acid stress chaperone HdeB